MFANKCQNCGNHFRSAQRSTVYCGKNCRNQSYRRRKGATTRRGRPTAISLLFIPRPCPAYEAMIDRQELANHEMEFGKCG